MRKKNTYVNALIPLCGDNRRCSHHHLTWNAAVNCLDSLRKDGRGWKIYQEFPDGKLVLDSELETSPELSR